MSKYRRYLIFGTGFQFRTSECHQCKKRIPRNPNFLPLITFYPDVPLPRKYTQLTQNLIRNQYLEAKLIYHTKQKSYGKSHFFRLFPQTKIQVLLTSDRIFTHKTGVQEHVSFNGLVISQFSGPLPRRNSMCSGTRNEEDYLILGKGRRVGVKKNLSKKFFLCKFFFSS